MKIFFGDPPPAAAEVPTELLYVHVRYIQTKDTPPKTIRRRCKGKKKVCRTYTRFYTLLATLTAASPALPAAPPRVGLVGDRAGSSGTSEAGPPAPSFRFFAGMSGALSGAGSGPSAMVDFAGALRFFLHRFLLGIRTVAQAPGAADVFGRPRAGDLPLPATRCPSAPTELPVDGIAEMADWGEPGTSSTLLSGALETAFGEVGVTGRLKRSGPSATTPSSSAWTSSTVLPIGASSSTPCSPSAPWSSISLPPPAA